MTAPREVGLNLVRRTADPLQATKARARAVGLDWAAVRSRLPDWAEEATSHKAGLIELEGFIARHFGYRLVAGGGFEPAPLPQALFKVRGHTAPAEIADARRFGTTVARMVAQATRVPLGVVPGSAATMRQLALAAAEGRGWVDFAALVNASWTLGIPVLYLPDLPVGGRKPDGMATFVAGRPVAVLMKKQSLAEWMVFILAHELGHVALAHLEMSEGAAVVDEKVSLAAEAPAAPGSVPEDGQEQDANTFASGILVPNGAALALRSLPKAEQLASLALDYGTLHGICPGHVVLNAAKNSSLGNRNLFGLGMAALKILHRTMDGRETAEICRDAARRYLDRDALKPDTVEFLEKLDVI